MAKPKKRTRSVPPLSDTDVRILNFIWWWKIASTAAITGRYYGSDGWKHTTIHWRMNRLRQRGYVKLAYADDQYGVVWTLTAKGFEAVKDRQPALREQGYASENIPHDLLVQAVHLGDWLPVGSPAHKNTFSEQELRRIDPGCYPEWVPESKFHRPDGYWRISRPDGKTEVIALEVELNAKRTEDYEITVQAYEYMHQVSCVLWVLESKGLALRIENAAWKRTTPARQIHQFVLISQFKELGWRAPIFRGTLRGRKIEDLLGVNGLMQGHSNAPATANHDWTKTILDAKALRVHSLPYQKEGHGDGS